MNTQTKQVSRAGRTSLARARKQLTADELFFFEHAGWSYKPGAESAQAGRMRCAKSLAKAEQAARNMGWTFEWSDDWDIGSHTEYFGADSVYEDHEPETCESCLVRDAGGNVLGSLGCIDDADSNYRRVIEAELSEEASDDLDREIDAIDVH